MLRNFKLGGKIDREINESYVKPWTSEILGKATMRTHNNISLSKISVGSSMNIGWRQLCQYQVRMHERGTNNYYQECVQRDLVDQRYSAKQNLTFPSTLVERSDN